MRCLLAVVFVLLAAFPALGRELMTTRKARVHERPDAKSTILAEIEPNVKISSDRRKDFWFHVSVEVGNKRVSGWVNQTDVVDVMGRSKGQLIAENKRLFAELTQLRRKTKAQAQEIEGAKQRVAALEQEKQALEAALKEVLARLKQARQEIQRLKTQLREGVK